MRERTVLFTYHFHGTLAANATFYAELAVPWTLEDVKATASNDSDATLAASGGATITAAVIGDSGDPVTLTPDTTPDRVAADTLVTFALDYDGASGTAGQNVTVIVRGLLGEA